MSSKIAPSCSLQTASSIRGDLRLPPVWIRSSSRDLSEDASDRAAKSSAYTRAPPSPGDNRHRKRSIFRLPQRWRPPCSSWLWSWPLSLFTWLSRCPQMWFLLLFVGCSYASGLYASTLLARWLLVRVGVSDAIGAAQLTYTQSSRELQSASTCVVETSLAQLTALRTELEEQRQHSRQTARPNAEALDKIEDRVVACT